MKDSPASEIILEGRVDFLHKLKGFVRFKGCREREKIVACNQLCLYLHRLSFALSYSERDMPDSETSSQLLLLIGDGFQAMSLKQDFSEDYQGPDFQEDKSLLLDMYWDDVSEIAERANTRYGELYDNLSRCSAGS